MGEIPESLVDWPATEKYEKDRTAGASVPEAVQLDKEIEHDRELEEAQFPKSRRDSASPKIPASSSSTVFRESPNSTRFNKPPAT